MAAERRFAVPQALAGVERFHRAAITGLFAPDAPAVAPDPALRFVFLCFTNRCGSNYLAELLASTGALNPAEEVFNGDTIAEHVRA